jgi:hypothetical protein
MNPPMKVAPYAIGGLLGGSLLKSAFGSKGGNHKQQPAAQQPMTSTGTVGPAPSF